MNRLTFYTATNLAMLDPMYRIINVLNQLISQSFPSYKCKHTILVGRTGLRDILGRHDTGKQSQLSHKVWHPERKPNSYNIIIPTDLQHGCYQLSCGFLGLLCHSSHLCSMPSRCASPTTPTLCPVKCCSFLNMNCRHKEFKPCCKHCS